MRRPDSILGQFREKPRYAAMRNTGTGFVVLSRHSLYISVTDSNREPLPAQCFSGCLPLTHVSAHYFHHRHCHHRSPSIIISPFQLLDENVHLGKMW